MDRINSIVEIDFSEMHDRWLTSTKFFKKKEKKKKEDC